MSRDERTYGKIRQQYDDWVESEANRPTREYLRREDTYTPPETRGTRDMSRMVFTAIGVGIGVVLLALAAYAFYTAAIWGDFGRDGAQVGYTLVGIFLLIAGFGGIIATWNHNFRVLTRPSRHH
ncbi:MAG: hypothetical protein WD766_04630 [Gemmatimonadota bacterium]